MAIEVVKLMIMFQIGLTGGIGSGKSTVATLFQMLDVPVYQADQRAKALMVSDSTLKKNIRTHFGPNAYEADKAVNRQFLADQVFGDEQQLEKLNQLIHPAVRADYQRWLQSQNANYVVHEAALIFEAGFEGEFDALISVSSPLPLRIKRVQERDSLSAEAVRARIQRQYDQAYKDERSDHVIKNDDYHLLIPAVHELDEHYTKIALEAT